MKRLTALLIALTLVGSATVAEASTRTQWRCAGVVYYTNGQHGTVKGPVTTPATWSAQRMDADYDKTMLKVITNAKRVVVTCRPL